mmetsp:Transcript_52244/g.58375  ORF Transcript_52244/g.58375 Transcript_52244/m.58375 type:complete len:84 (+) Transcript_52244:116-367(+)
MFPLLISTYCTVPREEQRVRKEAVISILSFFLPLFHVLFLILSIEVEAKIDAVLCCAVLLGLQRNRGWESCNHIFVVVIVIVV